VKTGTHPAGTSKTTVRFQTDGNCKFTKLDFDPPYNQPQYPPGFSHRVDDPNGITISYEFDGREIPYPPGYPFTYINDDKHDGNGSGIVKN
jgi:hypothetical protein